MRIFYNLDFVKKYSMVLTAAMYSVESNTKTHVQSLNVFKTCVLLTNCLLAHVSFSRYKQTLNAYYVHVITN